MKELWQSFLSDESGQGLVEYVLIIALVAIGLVAVMLIFRNAIGDDLRHDLQHAERRARQHVQRRDHAGQCGLCGWGGRTSHPLARRRISRETK